MFSRLDGLAVPVIGNLTVVGLLIYTVGFLIIWVILSIPVYLMGKFVTGGGSTLGDAMVATLFGSIVYIAIFFALGFLGAFNVSAAYVAGLAWAFLAWVYVFKASFRTGWSQALVIGVFAIGVFALLGFVFSMLLGVLVPVPFFPQR